MIIGKHFADSLEAICCLTQNMNFNHYLFYRKGPVVLAEKIVALLHPILVVVICHSFFTSTFDCVPCAEISELPPLFTYLAL